MGEINTPRLTIKMYIFILIVSGGFIIYETMKSQTSFLNPSVKDIQNQIGTSVEGFL